MRNHGKLGGLYHNLLIKRVILHFYVLCFTDYVLMLDKLFVLFFPNSVL